jgi:hypothetical protein
LYVHREKRLVYLAHMKVGSQAVRDVLVPRGFRQVYGHHGGPWTGRQHKFDNEAQEWWWGQDASRYTYIATVRNHFDILRTFWYWQRKDEPFPRTAASLSDFVQRFMWQRVAHFHNGRFLFRFGQEVPNLWVFPFEDQREYLAHMLWMHALPELEDHEYVTGQPNPAHATATKPRVPWAEEYTTETTAWVVDHFGGEMGYYGYTFDGTYPNFRKRFGNRAP